MPKYIHVDGDDGSLAVFDQIDEQWFGWVYEAPEDYKLELSLEDLKKYTYINEAFESDPRLKLVKKH